MGKLTDYQRGFEDAMKHTTQINQRIWAIEQIIHTGIDNADEIVKQAEKLLTFISSCPKSKKASRKYQ